MNDFEFMQRLLTIERRVDHLERLEPETGSGSGVVDGSGTAGQIAYWVDSDTLTSDADLTYTAATNTIGIDNIQFDTSPTPTTHAEALVFWDPNDETLNVGMPGGNVANQVGQELFVPRRVKNNTGADMYNGQLVYISGGDGNNAYVSLAKADAEATSAGTIAMLTEDIADTHRGYATMIGLVRGDAGQPINTLAYAPGTELYLSPSTAGGWTSSKPLAPNHMVKIGTVFRQHATEGSIIVHITNGFELEELHNVLISGLASGDVLRYNGTVWANSTLAAAGVVSGTGAANRMAWWSGANTITYNDILRKDTFGITIVNDTSTIIDNFAYGGTPAYRTNTASGTEASPTGIGSSGTLFNILSRAYTSAGSFSGNKVVINATVSEAWSGTAQGFYVRINTTATGTTTNTERLRIDQSGYFGFGVGAAPAVLGDWRENTAVTNTVQNLFDLSHTTTGTAADGFGLGMRHYLEDAGGTRRQALSFNTVWSTAAAGTRKAYSVLNPWDTAERDGLRLFADGALALVGIGLAVNPTARLQLPAGSATASTAPLKFTSGALLTAPEAGAVEYLTDRMYYTQTTGAKRTTISYDENFTQSFLLMGA